MKDSNNSFIQIKETLDKIEDGAALKEKSDKLTESVLIERKNVLNHQAKIICGINIASYYIFITKYTKIQNKIAPILQNEIIHYHLQPKENINLNLLKAHKKNIEEHTIAEIITANQEKLKAILDKDDKDTENNKSSEKFFLLQPLLEYYKGQDINVLFAIYDEAENIGGENIAAYSYDLDFLILRIDDLSQKLLLDIEDTQYDKIAAAMAHELLHKLDKEKNTKFIEKFCETLFGNLKDAKDTEAMKKGLNTVQDNFSTVLYQPIISDGYRREYTDNIKEAKSEVDIKRHFNKFISEIVPNIVSFAYAMAYDDVKFTLQKSKKPENIMHPLLNDVCKEISGFVSWYKTQKKVTTKQEDDTKKKALTKLINIHKINEKIPDILLVLEDIKSLKEFVDDYTKQLTETLLLKNDTLSKINSSIFEASNLNYAIITINESYIKLGLSGKTTPKLSEATEALKITKEHIELANAVTGELSIKRENRKIELIDTS